MFNTKQFRVRFRIKNTNNPTQEVIIQATSASVATQIFKQQNPGCEFSSVHEVR